MNPHYTRRQMIAATTLLAAAAFGKQPMAAPYRYVVANRVAGQPPLPADRYIPFDWAFAEIPAAGAPGQGDGLKLTWNQSTSTQNNRATGPSARLRITSATDVREECSIAVKTAVSGRTVGTLDVRFAMYLQPFELLIQPTDLSAVLTEGVTLTMAKGSKPFWFFTAGNLGQSAPDAYLPHLLLHDASDRTDEAAMAGTPDRWKERLLSLGSVQTFGWMEGCVLDGLHELSIHSPNRTTDRAKTVLAQHLDQFFGQNNLVYANLNNQKAVGTINTVESILPFAILAQTNPTHRLLQTAIAFCERHANADGVIADGTGTNRPIKTEECYTVSYPLAVLARTLNRPDLAQLAIQTALSRVRLLAVGASIYQRGNEQEAPVFENWSRGVAWYLLGLVKTLAHLPNTAESQPLKLALQNAVDTVLARQQPNGLWYCFMHQPETGYETSGTAGIAAALTYGVQKGLLPQTVLKAAVNARKGLIPFFTPDGYLTGTAQGNKGGDALQRGGFRVISPYTLGFLAHLDLPKS